MVLELKLLDEGVMKSVKEMLKKVRKTHMFKKLNAIVNLNKF
ncbi:hypothetical protein [Wolbachia endosymbiont of Litomosoides sigmodontis]|nr:hypothetical protein [Wolbachia endosymbiont of Litomosoides sigmodontis]